MSETDPDRELRDRLRALRVDAPDAGFSSALHRKLAAAGPIEEPSWWRRFAPRLQPRLLWPAAGLAAGVAGFLVLAQVRPQRPALGPETIAVARVPATKVALVRLNLSADVAVASAQIRVSLPDGLVFWTDGQELTQRAFEWTQPLHAGDNDLPIAVRGLRPGRYHVTVTASAGAQQIEDDVELEVTTG